MKEGWSKVSLEDVCRITSKLCDPREDEYLDLLHVGGANIESKTGSLIELKTAREEGLKSGKFPFDESMVLYSKIRPYLEKVTRPTFQGLCSADIYPLTPNEGVLSRDYLFHLMLTPNFTDFAVGGSGRAGMPKVNRKHLFSYKFSIPSLPEQKKIVEVLDKAFAAIDQAKANIEQNIANAKELFQSKLNQIFSQKGEGWVEVELFKVTAFIDYRGRTPTKTEEGIRLITAKNVRMGYLKRSPEEFIAEEDFDDWMTRGIPRKGDVLFTTEAPLANVTLLDTDEKIALAQRIITLCPDRDILSGEYLSYCLQSKVEQDRILEKGTGATVTGIKSKLLKEIPISVAPLSRQKAIVSKLDAVSESVIQLEARYQTKLDSLNELKKSILQKAFAGELT